MTVLENWLKRISILAILINLPAIGTHYYLAGRFHSAAVVAPGTHVKPVTGITTTGESFTEAGATAYPCHVLRYTSIHCPWCRQDEPAWQKLESALQQRGCDSTLLGSAATELPKDATSVPNRHWLAIVPATVARDINFYATPTTLVLDRQWKVVWSKMGILEKGDMAKAMAAVK
jgi:hypothetical protein